MTQEEFFYQCMDVIEHWLNGNRKLSDLREVTDKLYNEVTKPYWISVKEELPKIGWTMSDTVVVTDGNGGLRLAWYHQDEGWHFATGLTFEPTHWMPLPTKPVLSNSSKTVKKSKFDENCERFRIIFDGWDELTWEEKRDRINKFRCGG